MTDNDQKKAVECIISYEKNMDAGTATMIVTGVNAYTGSAKKTFKIIPFDVANNEGDAFKVELNPSYPYAKSGAKPVPEVTFHDKPLKEGKDYTLFYLNNKAVDDATGNRKPTVRVVGKGNFKGVYDITKTTFAIEQAHLDAPGFRIEAEDVVWTYRAGNWKTKKIKVLDADGKELKAGTDYEKEIAFFKNGTIPLGENELIDAGNVITVEVSGIGNYEGKVRGTYRIDHQDISRLTATIAPRLYTGGPITIKPSDIEWTDQGKPVPGTVDVEIVSYKNNINKGKATVVVRGVGGNCCGMKTITFAIGSRTLIWWWNLVF